MWNWFTHNQASSEEPPHEPNLGGDLTGVQLLPVGEEKKQVGDDADEGWRQQDQAHQAGALSCTTHGLSFFFFLSLGSSGDLTLLSRGSRWKLQETKKRRWTREKERAKESEREEITCGGSRHETQIQAVTVTAGNREGTKARCWRGCYRSMMSELGVTSHVTRLR